MWHPLSLVVCFDVAQALADPRHLDDSHYLSSSFNPGLAEENSACWLDDDCIAVATSAEPEQDSVEDDAGPPLRGLAVYDVIKRTCLRAFQLEEPLGTILALGKRYVLSLYRHPKLVDLSTGEVVHVWTELRSGLQDGSMIRHLDGDAKPPPIAFDPATNRFAIVNADTVSLIEFSHSVVSAG